MKIFNFGSLNIDHVYSVDHFVEPGETQASEDYTQFAGGKGLNQSVALAHAGARVVHVGRVGMEGAWLKEKLTESGVDVSMVGEGNEPTGHAIIQVDRKGENSIITYGGANKTLDEADVDALIDSSEEGDFVLMQNEATCIASLIERAHEKGLFVAINPAPITQEVQDYPLEKVDLIIINETEGEALTGISEPDEIIASLRTRYPETAVALTLGARGARYADAVEDISVPAEQVEAVDSTGAGDTFIGYFLAERMNGTGVEQSLEMACKAAGICVGRPGASDSIPTREEVI